MIKLKILLYMLLSVAALGLIACDHEDDDGDNTPPQVQVRIENDSGIRGTYDLFTGVIGCENSVLRIGTLEDGETSSYHSVAPSDYYIGELTADQQGFCSSNPFPFTSGNYHCVSTATSYNCARI